ncbi:MAG: two-component system response regulator, partial [Pseudonocardiales bacterium]
AALNMVQESPPDLLVLDIMLPDLDGLEVTRRLSSDGVKVPVLFLTARDSVDDKVAGLTVGGDDYVTKPFSLAEVVARARAILRRTSGSPRGDGKLRFGDLVMDEDSREVRRGDDPMRLTATEFNLLRFFMLNPRRVLSKSQILDNVWHYDFGGDPSVVETYASYLRKKLDRLGPPLIHTQRGVGYSLRLPEHAAAHQAHQASQSWPSHPGAGQAARSPRQPGDGPPGDEPGLPPGPPGREPGPA